MYWLEYTSCSAGKHLAEHCRKEYPRVPNFMLWILAEIAIVACDIPEGWIHGTLVGQKIISPLTSMQTFSLGYFPSFSLTDITENMSQICCRTQHSNRTQRTFLFRERIRDLKDILYGLLVIWAYTNSISNCNQFKREHTKTS